MRVRQIGMFAYTGLKPEQMETLAKEVRRPTNPLCGPRVSLTLYSSILCTLPRTAAYLWQGSRPATLSASPRPSTRSRAKPGVPLLRIRRHALLKGHRLRALESKNGSHWPSLGNTPAWAVSVSGQLGIWRKP